MLHGVWSGLGGCLILVGVYNGRGVFQVTKLCFGIVVKSKNGCLMLLHFLAWIGILGHFGLAHTGMLNSLIHGDNSRFPCSTIMLNLLH